MPDNRFIYAQGRYTASILSLVAAGVQHLAQFTQVALNR
jgi:hypothetical protein